MQMPIGCGLISQRSGREAQFAFSILHFEWVQLYRSSMPLKK
jgi:hypothetical protein